MQEQCAGRHCPDLVRLPFRRSRTCRIGVALVELNLRQANICLGILRIRSNKRFIVARGYIGLAILHGKCSQSAQRDWIFRTQFLGFQQSCLRGRAVAFGQKRDARKIKPESGLSAACS